MFRKRFRIISNIYDHHDVAFRFGNAAEDLQHVAVGQVLFPFRRQSDPVVKRAVFAGGVNIVRAVFVKADQTVAPRNVIVLKVQVVFYSLGTSAHSQVPENGQLRDVSVVNDNDPRLQFTALQ